MARLGRRWWPAFALALACAVARPCRGQQCSAERVGSAVINIDLSLPRGARVAEPRYAPTPQSCVRACCSGEEPSGDKPCNLVIFDAQRTSEYPNCYLFHCPSTEACPMTPVTGVVSYKITRDTRAPEDTAVQSEDLPSTAGALVSHSPSSHQSHATAFQQSVFHQASEFPPHVGKHLDSSEFHPVFPESQRVERPESADSIPRQQVMNLPPNKSSAVQTGNPSALFPTTQSSAPELSSTAPKGTTLLGSHATSLPGGAANPATASSATTAAFAPPAATRANPGIPATSTAVTHLPLSALTASASTFTIKQVATDSRSAAAQSGTRTLASPPEPTVVSSNSTSATSLSVSGFALSTRASPMAFPKNPQGYDPSDSAIYPSESALGGKDAVQPGEKSLEAALCFGVLLLVLVIALKGRTLHECLQKRHYTRLDYLINGMYTDV